MLWHLSCTILLPLIENEFTSFQGPSASEGKRVARAWREDLYWMWESELWWRSGEYQQQNSNQSRVREYETTMFKGGLKSLSIKVELLTWMCRAGSSGQFDNFYVVVTQFLMTLTRLIQSSATCYDSVIANITYQLSIITTNCCG